MPRRVRFAVNVKHWDGLSSRSEAIQGVFVDLVKSGLSACSADELAEVAARRFRGLGADAFESAACHLEDVISRLVGPLEPRSVKRTRRMSLTGEEESRSPADDEGSLSSDGTADTEEVVRRPAVPRPTSVPVLPRGGGQALKVGAPAIPLLQLLRDQLRLLGRQAYAQSVPGMDVPGLFL